MHFTPPRSLHLSVSCTPVCTRPRPFRRQHIHIIARHRLTRRATDQEPPPRDPFSRRRAATGVPPGPPPRSKEPFDAELLILFGLPTLILVIPWAVKDPAALTLIPLAFLVPGVRDVLLAVLRSTTTGVRKARVFMSEDDRRRGEWAPPPRPPPPPPPGVPSPFGIYDLSEEDFEVRPAGEEQWRDYEGWEEEERRGESSSSDEEEEESAAAATAAATAAVAYSGGEEEEEENGSVARRKRPRVPPSRAPRRVPPLSVEGGDAGTAAVRGWRRPQPRRPSYDTDEYEEEIDEEMAALERRIRRREAREARRRGMAAVGASGRPAAAPATRQQRRRRRRNVPWYVRPLLVAFPFLRDWGGFM